MVIEDVSASADIDTHNTPVVTLEFKGNFIEACHNYLDNSLMDTLLLQIGRTEAEKLIRELSGILND